MDQQIFQTLNEILTELREIKDYVLDLRARNRRPEKVLLSLQAAAARLGVSRNSTLLEMIERKQIRTVDANGKRRIPAFEIERVAAEGFNVFNQKRRRPVLKRIDTDPVAAVRALKV
jgi:hypothetical protein